MSDKTCTGCGQHKPLSEYYRAGGGRPGYRARCKACEEAYRRAYYAEHSRSINEKRKAQKAAYYQRTRDKWRAYYREYHPAYYQRRKAQHLQRLLTEEAHE